MLLLQLYDLTDPPASGPGAHAHSGAFGVQTCSKEAFDEDDLTEAKEAVAKYVKAGRKVPQSIHEASVNYSPAIDVIFTNQ